MLTIKELYDACRRWKQMRGTDIRKNSHGKPDNKGVQKGITLTEWRVKEGEDSEGDIYRVVTCKARDRGPQHSLQMLFYGDGSDVNTRAAVNCSCEYFLYYCEVALEKGGSSRIEEPIEMRIWSNGNDPKTTNEDNITIVCKHLYQALQSGAAKRQPRGPSLEDKRKQAAKEKEIEQRREKEAKKQKQKEEKAQKQKEKEKGQKTKLKENVKEKKPAIKQPPKPPEPKKYATPPKTKWKK